MTPRDLVVLAAVLGLAQALLWTIARLLGSRLPARVVLVALALPLLFLSPWLLGSRLLVPSNDLAAAIPGAVPPAAPDPHAILNDVVYQLLPWELEVRHALAERRLPLWSDALEGGSSPWLNPQSGVLSPIAFLSRPLPIQHHLAAGLALKMAIAFQGVWLLARALGAGTVPAGLGGASFALSGGIQAWALLPPSTTVAWVPWVALAALRVVRRGRPRHVAIGALLTAFLLLSGNPEVAVFGLGLVAVWSMMLGRRSSAPRPRRQRVRTTKATLRLAAMLALGASLAAPVLVPFLWHLPRAQRLEELAHERVPLETLDLSPRTWFLPRDAVLLETPLAARTLGRPYHGLIAGTLNWAEALGAYAGLVALAGAVLAAIGPRARLCALPFLFTSALGLVTAAGFLPLRAALDALPGASLAATGRLLPLVALGLAVAGALGWHASLTGSGGRVLAGARGGGGGAGRWRLWAALVLGAVAILSLRADGRLANALLWSGIVAALVAGWRRPRTAATLLAVVLALDLVPWALDLQPRGDTAAFYPSTPAIGRLRREAAAPGGPWRTTGEDLAVYPSLLTVYGLDEPRPHNPLAPGDYLRVLEAAFGFAPAQSYFAPFSDLDHPLLDFLGVRGVVSYSTRPGAPGFRPVPATLERFDVGELGTFRLLRNRDPLPRVFVPVVADVVRDDQLAEWLARLRDPRRVALAAGDASSPARAPVRFRAGAVEVASWRPGAIELRLSLPEGGLVATSIPGPEGWRVRSSAAVERVRVNGAFLGLRVPAGVGAVALAYRPPGFVPGMVSGGLAAVLVAALVVAELPRLRTRAGQRRRLSARARTRLRPPTVAAALLIGYLAVALARETRDALRPYWVYGPHAFRELDPARWRLESAPAERMAAFLAQVAPRIPEGSRVAFAGFDLPGTQSAYRAMWAAYLLPRHHVLPAGQAWDGEYWVAYRTRVERPDLELLWENEDGALYRASR